MNAPFRLYGAELSPYSVKVRSYLRYKGLDFEWRPRTQADQEEFARYAKLPLLPVLVDADEGVLQDSTPIIEALEREHPEPSITPDDPALAFVSALVEDFADEWVNKAMFHYRWTYPDDRESASRRTLEMIFAGAGAPDGAEEAVRTRQTGRLYHVGSSPETAALLESSFARLLAALHRMLGAHPYLLGGRPSLADFGLAGQLAQLLSDPTPGALIRAQAPNVVRWIERMEHPQDAGAFASLDTLHDDLAALLRGEIAGAYLPWMSANADAVADDAPGVSVEISGQTFTQKPQRYAAKAFAELRRKRAQANAEALDALLEATGCDAYLKLSDAGSSSDADDDDDADEENED